MYKVYLAFLILLSFSYCSTAQTYRAIYKNKLELIIDNQDDNDFKNMFLNNILNKASLETEVFVKNNFRKIIYKNKNLTGINIGIPYEYSIYDNKKNILFNFKQKKTIKYDSLKKFNTKGHKITLIKDTLINNMRLKLINLTFKNNNKILKFYINPKLPNNLFPIPGELNLELKGGVQKIVVINNMSKQFINLESFEKIPVDKNLMEDIKLINNLNLRNIVYIKKTSFL